MKANWRYTFKLYYIYRTWQDAALQVHLDVAKYETGENSGRYYEQV